jgi:hypothetical protein
MIVPGLGMWGSAVLTRGNEVLGAVREEDTDGVERVLGVGMLCRRGRVLVSGYWTWHELVEDIVH